MAHPRPTTSRPRHGEATARSRPRQPGRLRSGLGALISEPHVARRWMLSWCLLLVVATLWLPHPTGFSREALIPVLAAMIATWLMALLTSTWSAVRDRVVSAALLMQVHVLVALTGGEESLYVVLYLGLLTYGAMFYSRSRMIVTYVLVALLILVPRLYIGDLDPATLSREIVRLGVWGIVTVSAYALTRHLRQASTTDALTGLTNRGALWELARAEHDRSTRYGHPYSLLLADIDLFKQTNDRYGHRAGDRVLSEVAGVLRSRARAGDIVARYGGEEFVILLPETTAGEARVVAEDLRRGVSETVRQPPTTLSIGVASREGHAMDNGLEMVLEAADRALYVAKEEGRNRVCGGEMAVP